MVQVSSYLLTLQHDYIFVLENVKKIAVVVFEDFVIQ